MTVSFGSHARGRIKRPRVSTRKTFVASYDGEYLAPKRGAWTRSIDALGDVVADGQDPRALLIANRGDQLFLFGARVEQIAIVEIVGVEADGFRYRVATRFAIEAVTAGEVFVMRRRAKK